MWSCSRRWGTRPRWGGWVEWIGGVVLWGARRGGWGWRRWRLGPWRGVGCVIRMGWLGGLSLGAPYWMVRWGACIRSFPVAYGAGPFRFRESMLACSMVHSFWFRCAVWARWHASSRSFALLFVWFFDVAGPVGRSSCTPFACGYSRWVLALSRRVGTLASALLVFLFYSTTFSIQSR